MRILKTVSGPDLFLQIEGADEGGMLGIQIDNVYVEASKFRRAWEEFREMEYQESPFESFQSAVNMAMQLESQNTQYDGTPLATIVAVRRVSETKTYIIEIAVPDLVSGGVDALFTLARMRDVRELKKYIADLRERTGRTGR